MFEEFDARTHTRVMRDAAGTARMLFHADRYVATTARTPQLAARDYLGRYGRAVGTAAAAPEKSVSAGRTTTRRRRLDYRLLAEKHQFDLTTVAFHQTCFGLPVWEAGLSVTIKHNPLRVVGARSTSMQHLR